MTINERTLNEGTLDDGTPKEGTIKKLGGKRPGAGRPKGSGQYQEKTYPMRLPSSLLPEIKQLLSRYRRGEKLTENVSAADNIIFAPQQFPLYESRVSAGFPSPADDYIEAKLDLNQYLVKHPAATFFVRVEGDSMIGAGIFPEDILVVDRSLTPKDGKIVIAVINGELTVKRLKQARNKVVLMPENDAFSPIEITEEMNFSIWGVVTAVVHSV